jgi:diguanylate cyclase (GGDEF)-like protein
MTKQKKILIVDDDPFIIHTLKDKIELATNVEVLTASSYKECVTIIRNDAKDIAAAIVDIKVSGAKDGGVLHLTNLNKIPSIVFTSIDDASLKASFLQKHVIEYVIKNTLQTLEYTVNLALRIVQNYDINILIVDDSSMSLNMLAITLDKMHFNIHKAKDGVEALKVLDQDKKFSLVLTDYHMPNMDGLELTQEIRKRYKKDELAIIAISGQEDSESTSLFLKVGANDFIKKPYSYEELALRINLNLDMIDLFTHNKQLATRDTITAVHNEQYFADSAEAIFLKAERDTKELLVAMVSIDHFQDMIKSYGDDSANRILIESAKLMQATIRKSDLIARQSHETFSILFENISRENSETLLKKLHENIKKLSVLVSKDTTITPKLSIGAVHGRSESLNEMLKHAYQAMTVSQTSGGNKTTFFEL